MTKSNYASKYSRKTRRNHNYPRTERFKRTSPRKNWKKRQVKSRQGRGVLDKIKKAGKFIGKNSKSILKGARYLAKASGNKTINRIANSHYLDKGAEILENLTKEGRGMTSKKKLLAKAKRAVDQLVGMYGANTARLIILNYIRRGRGFIGPMLAGILPMLLPKLIK